eukprot:COSAG06_NODE_38575_length_422_cov_0.650155_1_plen_84_part_10
MAQKRNVSVRTTLASAGCLLLLVVVALHLLQDCKGDVFLWRDPCRKKRTSFFEWLSLCLSRACLGKLILFSKTWCKICVFLTDM